MDSYRITYHLTYDFLLFSLRTVTYLGASAFSGTNPDLIEWMLYVLMCFFLFHVYMYVVVEVRGDIVRIVYILLLLYNVR